VKYAIFRRDPRAQLLVDDPAGFRAVLVPATVEIREDLRAEPRFRAIREKHAMAVPGDDEHLRALAAEGGSCWPSHQTGHFRAGRVGAWTDGPSLTPVTHLPGEPARRYPLLLLRGWPVMGVQTRTRR